LLEPENHVLPEETNESWRSWLMTGVRKRRLDPRRLQGSHRGLKKILAEGLVNNGAGSSYAWREFSGVMVRHAVDDAMRDLPEKDTHVVKLAYFGGYSNREIASKVGITEAAVERRLRRALAAITEHIQQGRAVVRRAAYWVGLIIGGRWLGEVARHSWQAAAVATAAVVIVATQDAPAPATGAGTPRAQSTVAAPATRTVEPPLPSPTLPVAVPSAPATVPNVGSVVGAVPQVQSPATLPAVTKLIQKIKKLL
jgi:hypothetical protein